MRLRPKRKNRRNRYRKKPGSTSLRRQLAAAVRLVSLALAIMVLSTMLVYAYQVVTGSEYLALRKIQVSGNRHLDRNEIIRAAGLKTGINLLSLNLSLVRKRLLANPWIATAQVTRQVPDTLQIIVGEHRPLAVLELGSRYLLNRKGRIFKRWQPGDPDDLPVITGLDLTDIHVGSSPESHIMRAVRQALLATGQARCLPLSAIARVEVDKQIGLTLVAFKAGVKIHLGFDGFAANYGRLARVVNYLKKHGRWHQLRSIDLTDPHRMVVKLSQA